MAVPAWNASEVTCDTWQEQEKLQGKRKRKKEKMGHADDDLPVHFKPHTMDGHAAT